MSRAQRAVRSRRSFQQDRLPPRPRLTRQQGALPGQAGGKAAQPVVRSQHSMARHEHRNRISAAGGSNRPGGSGPTHKLRQPRITHRLARRKLAERPPNLLLKLRSRRKVQGRQVFRALTAERAGQGLGGCRVPAADLRRNLSPGRGALATPSRRKARFSTSGGKLQPAQPLRRIGRDEFAFRCRQRQPVV